MQSLWILNLEWDAPVPEAECQQWISFSSDLHHISEFRIPRELNINLTSQKIELHGISDALKRAYVAIIYLCVNNKKRLVVLVASKVAPVEQVSLSRLELYAAQLVAC